MRVDSVILGSNVGGECGGSPDQMVGIVTAGGAEWPLRASNRYWPSPVDNTMIEASNFRRVSRLSQAFAFWVARGV